MNQNNVLYIFKYNGISYDDRGVDSYFLATSKEECQLFLDTLGYKNLSITPLKPGEDKPNFNTQLELSEVALDLSVLFDSLKASKPMLQSVIDMVHRGDKNSDIYERVAYFVYKGDSLSVAMQKLGNIIPRDIIDEINLGELKNDIPRHLAIIIRRYGKFQKKKSIFEKIFGTKEKDDLNGINIVDDSKDAYLSYQAKMFPFKYSAVDDSGKKKNGYFNAESVDDCVHFLEHAGYTSIHVEPKKSYDVELIFDRRISISDLAFDLTQLSTYLKAGIPLVEGVEILAKQSKKTANRNAYDRLVYDLLKGDNLSTAMIHQGDAFPKLLINMIKSAEMTGDLTTVLDDMADYYEDITQTKKAMRSAMVYPVFVLLLAIGVLSFMLLVLVPEFVTLYQANGADLPDITKAVINMSNFFIKNYPFIILIIVLFITAYIVCYKNFASFRLFFQTIAMKLPGAGKLIIYNEIYNFTKTFASLLNHGVFITDSMQILGNITNNEIYKRIINKTLSNLARGNGISDSFKNEWAFPNDAYHMIVTGESTGQLGLMMEKVSDHYKELHKSMVDSFKSMLEPVMIIIVAVIVGVILLSIVTPMFDIYNQIR